MNKKGYLLIETVIAIAVFAIVAIGFMQGIQVGMLGTYRVDVSNTALNLARSQMEYIKAQSYILYDYDCTPREGQPYLIIKEIPTGFNASFTVCNVPDMDPNIVQHVTVTVTYQSESNVVELEGYKINPNVLPPLRDLPFIQTTDIHVPILPGTDRSDASRDGSCNNDRFLLFYGYPFTFNITRAGVVAVTWIIDEDETYGSGNLIDLYLYRNADFPNGDGRPDGPFFNEKYDYSWDTAFYNEELDYSSSTTCQEGSVPPSNCADCTNGKNWWDDADPDYPRIVLMDDPDCYTEDARYCHDEEVPGWNTPWFCCSEDPGQIIPEPVEPGWIAHDEVLWPDPDKGNVLTTVVTREEGTLSGTVTFTLGSTSITGSGTSFSDELEAGNYIRKSDGEDWYTVASIGSDTLTLTTASNDDGDDTVDATLYRDEIVPAGWYTIFFYNSNPIHNDGDCFYGAPQYCTNPRIFTVASELASLSYYSIPQ